MTTALDPTRICFSDMLLSEFVGNHSVYYYGYPNPVQSDVWSSVSTVYNGWTRLAQTLLAMRNTLSESTEIPCNEFSISYGWIHPRLSERIVKWKNPTHPSYHRWDEGAAADINFHHTTFGPYYYGRDLDHGGAGAWTSLSPLGVATRLNCPSGQFPQLDRTITYSESPYICLGVAPGGRHGRGKWYENRFTGVCGDKPHFITHNTGISRPVDGWQPPPLEGDWRGCGHPTYHLYGKVQYQHIRTSLYTMVSDWLYNRDKVHFGHANRMPTSSVRYDYIKNMMHYAGRAYDVLQALAAVHLPIIEGINLEGRTSNWEATDRWSFVVACPPAANPVAARTFYQLVQDQVVPQQGEMLRITAVEEPEERQYISANGREVRATQHRIRITGEYDGPVQQPAGRFDFTSAAQSPGFREDAGGDGSDSVPDPERVSNANPRTRRRRRTGTDVRRGIRTRTFSRRDQG